MDQQLCNNEQIVPIRKLEEGRWSKEEHARFIEGIKLYNKNWKKVEEHVKTRSGAQIRSHAQKFFNRLEKEMEKKQLTQQMAIDQENEKVLAMIIMKKKEKNEEKQRKKENNMVNVLSQQSLNSFNIDNKTDSYIQQTQPVEIDQQKQKFKKQEFQQQELQNHYNKYISTSNNIQSQKNIFYNPLKNSLPQVSPLGFSQYGLIQNLMLNCYSNWMRQCQQVGKYPHLFSSPDKFKGIESQVLEKFENYIQCQKQLKQQEQSKQVILLQQQNIENNNNSNNSNNQNKKIGSFKVFNTKDNSKQFVKVSNFKRKFSNSFTQLDDYESNTNTSQDFQTNSEQSKKIKMY